MSDTLGNKRCSNEYTRISHAQIRYGKIKEGVTEGHELENSSFF